MAWHSLTLVLIVALAVTTGTSNGDSVIGASMAIKIGDIHCNLAPMVIIGDRHEDHQSPLVPKYNGCIHGDWLYLVLFQWCHLTLTT